MGNYFASPDDTKRIAFTEGVLAGEWIQIRRRISYAEEQGLLAHLVTGVRDDEGKHTRELNTADYNTQRLRFWLKRWSLGTEDERGMKPTREQLDTLLPECANQVLEAIDAHEAELAAESEVATHPLQESGSTGAPSLTLAPAFSGMD